MLHGWNTRIWNPSRVGGDRGVENVNVARFVIDQKGVNRIERL